MIQLIDSSTDTQEESQDLRRIGKIGLWKKEQTVLKYLKIESLVKKLEQESINFYQAYRNFHRDRNSVHSTL